MSDEGSLNLFQQQDANRRRTVWLIVCFVLFFAWLGFGGDYIYSLSTAHAPPAQRHDTWWFGVVMLGLGIGLAWYAYRTGAEKVLWATGAVEVIAPTDEATRQLVNVVEEMAIAAGVPRPRIWLVPDADPNAFATGNDPPARPRRGHARIARSVQSRGASGRDRPRARAHQESRRPAHDDARRSGWRRPADPQRHQPNVSRRARHGRPRQPPQQSRPGSWSSCSSCGFCPGCSPLSSRSSSRWG